LGPVQVSSSHLVSRSRGTFLEAQCARIASIGWNEST
jgi:hypothetical protein